MVSAALVLSVGLLVYQLLVRQRKFERQVAHQDRLSSLGSLAAGFAHEVRNPLEIISACTEDLERSLAGRPGLAADAIESCRDIMEEVDRLNRLVGQFLAYARPTASGGDLQSAPADECVASVAGMLRHVAEKRRVIVESSFSGDGARTRTRLDGGALRQVLINLTLNAIQATPSGGLVRLSGAVEGRNLRLIVEDSGPGIPPAIRGKIFDPFFTTRDDGSGLGLSIAHQLVVRSGGRLECDDRPLGKGARFTVTLPLTERPPMATVAAPKPVET
jgi:signal transduction histidine kinase